MADASDKARGCDYRVAAIGIILRATHTQQKTNVQKGLVDYFSNIVHDISISGKEFWNALKPLRTCTAG